MKLIKHFADYDAQLAHLKSKGLVIEDEKQCVRTLKEIGYFYLITGYRTIFYDEAKQYKSGTTFQNIVDLYNLDHQLRSLFLEYTLHIERQLKSISSYAFLSRFGDLQSAYLDPAHYSGGEREVRRLIDIFKSIIDSGDRYRYIEHYTKTGAHVPLWAAMNALTLGSLIKFIEFADESVKRDIASNFPELTPEMLVKMTKSVYELRNCCAHNEWLYDIRLDSAVPDLKLHMALDIPRNENGYVLGKRDLFSSVISLKYLLPPERFAEFKEEFTAKTNKYPEHKTTFSRAELFSLMGFPEAWAQI